MRSRYNCSVSCKLAMKTDNMLNVEPTLRQSNNEKPFPFEIEIQREPFANFFFSLGNESKTFLLHNFARKLIYISNRVLRDSTPRFVPSSVYVFHSLTSLLQPKWSSDLKCGPCPPPHDWRQPCTRLSFCLGGFEKIEGFLGLDMGLKSKQGERGYIFTSGTKQSDVGP